MRGVGSVIVVESVMSKGHPATMYAYFFCFLWTCESLPADHSG